MVANLVVCLLICVFCVLSFWHEFVSDCVPHLLMVAGGVQGSRDSKGAWPTNCRPPHRCVTGVLINHAFDSVCMARAPSLHLGLRLLHAACNR